MARVSGLRIYPIKSLGGVELEASFIQRRGLRDDRRMMLVDANGKFLTQRSDERLCRFRLAVIDGGFVVTGPDGRQFEIGDEAESNRVPVQVWSSELEVPVVSAEASTWFSDQLGQPVRLVRMPDDIQRATNPDFSEPGDHVSFADGFPILAISEASLAELNSRLEVALPMDRFRPNVILSECEPFEEDTWPRVKIGEVSIRFTKRCGRCKVTTIDQATGEVGQEPLRTLATYRKEGSNVMFGANWTPDGEGPISVGDRIEVIPS